MTATGILNSLRLDLRPSDAPPSAEGTSSETSLRPYRSGRPFGLLGPWRPGRLAGRRRVLRSRSRRPASDELDERDTHRVRQGAGAAGDHYVVGVFEAGPLDALALEQVETQGYFHRGFQAGAAHLAVALQSVAVAEIEESAAVKDRIETDVRPYQTSNIERFRKEVKNSEVIVLPNTNHYFFRDPKLFDNVVSTVRRFLLEPTQ